MRLDADHRVDLDVIPHDDLVVAIFGREVPVEALQTKASRVCREIRFDCAKRQAAFCDEALDDRHDLLGLDYVGDAVIAGRARNKAVRFRFAQVGHESSCADGRIDLEGRSKQRVANRQPWTTSLLLRFGDFAAQVAEQAAEVSFSLGCAALSAGQFVVDGTIQVPLPFFTILAVAAIASPLCCRASIIDEISFVG